MALLYSPTATATVAANTNAVTVAGMDLNSVLQGMVLYLGARDRITGDGFIVTGVAPTGTSGGTLTTVGPIPTGFTNAAFVVDTRDFNGSAATYGITMYTTVLATLLRLTSPLTNLFSGSRVLALDKDAPGAVSRLLYAISGRTWGGLEQRTLTFTPTGAAATSAETLALRAYPDGTTPSDAILVDLTTGGVDVQAALTGMASATIVDLASAPMMKVALYGSATISSFGIGKHKVREIHFVDGGAILVHNATTLILPTARNILTRPGDTMRVVSDGSGNWRVLSYQRADGTPLSLSGAPAVISLNGAFSPNDLGRRIRISGSIGRTLPPIASIYPGWSTGEIENNGTGLVTIAASGTDPFEGTPSSGISLFPRQRAYFYLDTDGWHIGWIDRNPIVASATIAAAQAVTAIDLAIPSGYPRFSLDFSGVLVTARGGVLTWQTSDNGSTFKAGASDYTNQVTASYNNSVVTNLSSAPFGELIGSSFGDLNALAVGSYQFYPGEAGASRWHRMIGSVYYLDSAPNNVLASVGGQCSGASSGTPARSKLLRMSPTSGLVYGSFTLRGAA